MDQNDVLQGGVPGNVLYGNAQAMQTAYSMQTQVNMSNMGNMQQMGEWFESNEGDMRVWEYESCSIWKNLIIPFHVIIFTPCDMPTYTLSHNFLHTTP